MKFIISLRLFTAILLMAGAPTLVFSQKVTAVTAVGITVDDLDREVEFFTKILDFKKVNEETWPAAAAAQLFNIPASKNPVRVATLQLGAESIRLFDFSPSRGSIKAKQDLDFLEQTRSNDLWFHHIAIVVTNMDSAYQRLLKNHVTHVSTAPQTLPAYLPAAAGIQAFYFRDPEGHNLELISFPKGKGDSKWASAKTLFAGIDHTAIGISNTESSTAFYRDALGLSWAGHSENYGTEQEHLNQVFGARLDINGLRASEGFGVEFLRYIAPPGGKSYPVTSTAANLWHYHTELETDQLDGMIIKLKKAGYRAISKGKTRMTLNSVEFFMLRDPDGHAVLLKSKL